LREVLLAAVADGEDRPDRLPKPTAKKWDVWDNLHHGIVERLLWDYDFAMGDEFLDLPPEEARAKLEEFGIDPEYYLEVPPEPGKKGLIAARQTLARLLGHAVPDDNGLYPALLDRYHDLSVGPVTPDEIAAWESNPWVEVIGSTEPDWECDFTTWHTEFSGTVPTTAFTVLPADPDARYELPDGIRAERSGEAWVVRDERMGYWCGLVENGWTDAPDDSMPALSFLTEADAKAAFVQAEKMYEERSERRAGACERLGIPEEPD